MATLAERLRRADRLDSYMHMAGCNEDYVEQCQDCGMSVDEGAKLMPSGICQACLHADCAHVLNMAGHAWNLLVVESVRRKERQALIDELKESRNRVVQACFEYGPVEWMQGG